MQATDLFAVAADICYAGRPRGQAQRTAVRPYIAEIPHRLAGIPCRIGVLEYVPYSQAYTEGRPEQWRPAEGGHGKYHILDRKGYRARWLEAKIDAKEEAAIQDAIFYKMEWSL